MVLNHQMNQELELQELGFAEILILGLFLSMRVAVMMSQNGLKKLLMSELEKDKAKKKKNKNNMFFVFLQSTRF